MKTPAIALLLTITLAMATAGSAAAEPHFEVIDRGTAVEVIAYEIKAARTAVNPARSRLEIDLIGFPNVKALTPTVAGVTVIELDGANPRRLSVKLPLERLQVKTVARFAQAIQVGDDLHLLFPREVPVEGARVVLPEPTLPKEIAAKLGARSFGPQPEQPASAKTETKPEPTEAKGETKPETKAEPIPAKPDEKKAFLAPEESSSSFSLYAMAGLAAIALGLWMFKHKKKAAGVATPATIDVIATRSLGSKAKVVWLNAGGREMVVAVTPQAVRMLGQWKKSETPTRHREREETPAQMPFAQALESLQRNERHPRAATSSPIAGILKLRDRASTYERVSEEVATDDVDADALWAKEILGAVGGRR